MKRAFLVLLFALAGCEQKMADMPREKTFGPSSVSPDGAAVRPPVAGTVAEEDALAPPPEPPVTLALLERGRERYDIFCAPCHSPVGDGDGLIVRRGFPHPPSFHEDALRNAPDAHFFDVITHGYGVMYPYASRVPAADRWAIVAYIRALQLSQYAALDTLPEALRAKVETGP